MANSSSEDKIKKSSKQTKESVEVEETSPKTTNKSGEYKEPSTFQKLRGSRNFRLGLIFVLMIIVAVMFYFWEKMRIFLAIIFLTLLTAFGLEFSGNDFDLGTLMKTKSFEESKVQRDAGGNILFDKEGNITTDSSKGKQADEYNCDDFSSQPESQRFFERVGGTGNDINRLDGDKDGESCESLPKGK